MLDRAPRKSGKGGAREGGDRKVRREETGPVGWRERGRALRAPPAGSWRRRGAKPALPATRKSSQVSAMEPAPGLELGDSSLHSYLDGNFWSLKNELRRLLGGCPLFRQRYRAAAVDPARAHEPAELVSSVPGASLRTPPRRGRGGVCAAPERQAPSSPADGGLSPPRYVGAAGWPPPTSSAP